jgi:hypothetical protein
MEFKTNKDGNLELTFTSPINIDNGFTNTPQGIKTSTMELYKDPDGTPTAIEWIISDGEFVEQIGLWFEDKDLIDYDGIFELPSQAIKLIEQAGFNVSNDFRN